MRRQDLGLISIDERLEDTLNVSPYRRSVSRTVVISHSSLSHKKAQKAQYKDGTSFEHGFTPSNSFFALSAFL